MMEVNGTMVQASRHGHFSLDRLARVIVGLNGGGDEIRTGHVCQRRKLDLNTALQGRALVPHPVSDLRIGHVVGFSYLFPLSSDVTAPKGGYKAKKEPTIQDFRPANLERPIDSLSMHLGLVGQRQPRGHFPPMLESPGLGGVITVCSHAYKVHSCRRDRTSFLCGRDDARGETLPVAYPFDAIFNRPLWVRGADEAAVERVGDVVTWNGLLGGHETLRDG